MKVCRLLSLARKSAPLSFRALAPFSASISANHRSISYFTDEDEEGFSGAYRHALKFRRPPSLHLRRPYLQSNSVSLIGIVCIPPKIITTLNPSLGVWAILDVKTSPESEPTLRVSLIMWDYMAEIFLRHFSCNDFIYVAGRLENGGLRTYCKVKVKELNFVTPLHQYPTCQKSEEPQPREGEAGIEEYSVGLQLWKVFFANPSKWLDGRNTKYTSSHPDFIHRDTHKALWQWPNDPPWIQERLDLLDLKRAEQGQDKSGSDKYAYNIHLWETFFTNPYQWSDARETKKSPGHPDFRHKYTDQALWLNPNDPPWIRKQLESFDLQTENQGQGESGLDKYNDDIYLWQVFFASPDMWWDNRKNKTNPRAPDFKHKDTDEALWQSPDDPPWIKRQLELLDLRREKQGLGEDGGSRSRVSLWEYDQ